MSKDSPVIPVVMLPPEGGYDFIPRMSIVHADSEITFNDNPLSMAQMSNMIFLGGARQRNMFNWGDDPTLRGLECESKDFEHGKPTLLFPWEESNFTKELYTGPGISMDERELDCGSCVFANWVKDPEEPKGSRAPRCVEQVVGLFLVPMSDTPNNQAIEFRLGQLTFQKSSLKPVSEYLQQFKRKQRAPYETLTSVRLNKNLGRGFSYSVPSLTSVREVDSDAFPHLSRILRAGRAALLKPTPKPAPKATGFLGVTPASAEDKGERYTGTFF